MNMLIGKDHLFVMPDLIRHPDANGPIVKRNGIWHKLDICGIGRLLAG